MELIKFTSEDSREFYKKAVLQIKKDFEIIKEIASKNNPSEKDKDMIEFCDLDFNQYINELWKIREI